MRKLTFLFAFIVSTIFAMAQVHTGQRSEQLQERGHGLSLENFQLKSFEGSIKGGDFTLTIEIMGQGDVWVNGEPYQEPIVFDENEEVTIIADPMEGYEFFEWSGDLTGSEPEETFIMDDDKMITATFTPIPVEQFTLNLDITGSGMVFVNGIPFVEEMQFEEGEELMLWATPEEGYEFIEWDVNGIIVADNPGVLVIEENLLIGVLFDETLETQYTLTINIEGGGMTFPPAGVYYFMENDMAAVMAMEVEGLDFIGWTGDIESEELIEMILMDEDKVVTAHYEEITAEMFTLTIIVDGQGHVLVEGVEYTDPLDFDEGTEVNLEAVADEGWMFVEWTEDLESTEMVETITMDDNKTIYAVFDEAATFTLTVDIMGNGVIHVNGTEYTAPMAINAGAEVEIEAVANEGWFFAGWMGDIEGNENPETFTMDDDMHITANFTAVYFHVNFEEETPVWTFGSDAEFGQQWMVGNHDNVPADWKTAQGYYFMYLGYFSETGSNLVEEDVWEADGHWAWINIVSELITGNGPEAQDVGSSWIQFDNIDLSESDLPQLVFYQLYRKLNDVAVFVDFSTDQGENWTSIQMHEDVQSNQTHSEQVARLVQTLFLGNYLANEPDVSIRFRWETISLGPNGVGYGWQIDDIKIVDAATAYDVGIEDARVHFWEYVDPAEHGANYFHYSSHYGQIPAEQFNSEFALSWFSVVVENFGVETVTPSLNVKVFDPNQTIVYDETISGKAIAITERDTIDIVDLESGLELPNDPIIGKYTVVYEVFIDGVEDENPENNVDTAYFYVTERTMSRDAKVINARTGPGMWMSGGNDGDALATNYTFLYEDEITSVDLYIHEMSDPGTALIVRLYAWMGSSWVDITQSTVINIEEEHIGEWLNVTFLHPAHISFPEGQEWLDIRVAIEFYYNEPDNELWIGEDRGNNNYSFWGAVWYFVEGANAGQWFSITNWPPAGLGIRVNTGVPQEYEVTFTVTDTEAEPIENATITVDGYNDITTDENGIATIMLVSGNYMYAASAEGYASIANQEFTVSGAAKNIDVILESGSLVTFNVMDVEQEPIEGAVISIDGFNPITTDANGVAKIELLDGTYEYSVDAAEYFEQSDLSFVVAGEDLVIEITMIFDNSSVETSVFDNLSIYPNPTTGQLNIENVEGANIEFINIMGQTVKTIFNANNFVSVDMSNYANGAYIIRIVKENEVSINRIHLVD